MSNKTFVQITLQDVRARLQKEKGWIETITGNEYVFSHTLKHYPDIQIKVFSSVRTDNALGRKCGADAIRICAINTKTNRGYIESVRVYRIARWRDNLMVKVLDVIQAAESRAHREGMQRKEAPKSAPGVVTNPVLTITHLQFPTTEIKQKSIKKPWINVDAERQALMLEERANKI